MEPTRRLLADLGNPQGHYPIVHVGGTNGKGSVVAMIASALRAGGHRVGAYMSPHLVSVGERITVDDQPISEDAFAVWTARMQPEIEATKASFFEASSAMAMAHFAASDVDVAVLEVGLGGRLDSTNVVDPIVSAVTNVGWDHQEYLGDTLESIAAEKAAIAKSGVPFVVGEPDPRIAALLEGQAAGVGAFPITVPEAAAYEGRLRLEGEHQRRNAAIARTILSSLPEALAPGESSIAAGLERAWLPGRFERRGRWILDVAHNPAGIRALVDNVIATDPPRPRHVLLGVLRDKPLESILAALWEIADQVWLTSPPSAPPHRQMVAGDVEHLSSSVRLELDFDVALECFGREAKTLIVTGSFHTVGDAMARLPGFPPFG